MIVRTKALSHRKAQKARSRLKTANPQSAASSLRALVTWLAVSAPAELATRPPPSRSESPADRVPLAVGSPRARRLRAGVRRGLGGPGGGSALLVRCCANAGPDRDTCRAGLAPRPSQCAQGHRSKSEGRRGRIPQEACALPRPGASPYEPSRGRGPGSAQFAGGYPGHCALHGSSVSKSMKPRKHATAGVCAECTQFMRSRPRRCGGDITPHQIGVGVREWMCSARPA